MKNKRSFFYAYVFLAVMVFITFFSKTIYYYCMPKVEVVRLKAVPFLVRTSSPDGEDFYTYTSRPSLSLNSVFGEYDLVEDEVSSPLKSMKVKDGNELYVWVTEEEGQALRLEKRVIKTGVTDGVHVEILEGLKQSDRIVAGWDRFLEEGQQVVEVLE